MNNYRGTRPRPQNTQVKLSWRPVERRLGANNAVVEVNELPLPIPRYSFKIGTAKLDDNGQIIDIQPFLNPHNVIDAADLLRMVGEKYIEIREGQEDDADRRRGSDSGAERPFVTAQRRTRL